MALFRARAWREARHADDTGLATGGEDDRGFEPFCEGFQRRAASVS
ncbi:MAG: hypothetical protein WAV18_17250 [Roseiarcus sp.]